MAADNLYEELKRVLQDFKTFLDANVPTIKPAITAIKSIVPQITELLDKLIDLMGRLRMAISNLNVGAVPGLSQLSTFTAGIKTLLETSKNLLPAEAGKIDEVLAVVNVVSGLPTLDQVKNEILTLLDQITAHLNSLKA